MGQPGIRNGVLRFIVYKILPTYYYAHLYLPTSRTGVDISQRSLECLAVIDNGNRVAHPHPYPRPFSVVVSCGTTIPDRDLVTNPGRLCGAPTFVWR